MLAPRPGEAILIRVFVRGGVGGNPVPLVAHAHDMDAGDMREVARHYGHESAFVLPATRPDCDLRLRFFVPAHEMEMCGHATVGALWALRQWGRWVGEHARVETASGVVDIHSSAATGDVWISQPVARIAALDSGARRRVADVLGVPASAGDAAAFDMAHASTSRVKTLVRLPDVDTLHALQPDFGSIESTCEAIGSTGLYPYAIDAGPQGLEPRVHARQFPQASGYPEDAATGIAAAALWGYLTRAGAIARGSHADPRVCTVLQGEAMGSPSAIRVKGRWDGHGVPAGCWLGGDVTWMDVPAGRAERTESTRFSQKG
jgi:trans-2,3-dihydro-3-hydroxyanthranilate isomerase